MTELHYRYIIGLERLHIGRLCLARPLVPVHDEVAASLQPCVAPGTIDVQAPFEAQGRGYIHGHGKGHSIIGLTMKWLRTAMRNGFQNISAAVNELRESLLDAAATVQYEAAREPGIQLSVDDLRPEPFTARQQRQSRMDGAEDEDGTIRELVQIAPPLVQPHIERERSLASSQNRMAREGAAAYRNVPLTSAFQCIYPWFRLRTSFHRLGCASQPTECDDAQELSERSFADVFDLDEVGRVTAVLKPDGEESTTDDLHADARLWASHFGHDTFNNHCTNHEHDCTETCVKYVKKKLEAKQSLRSHKVPSCRFWFFRIHKLHLKEKDKRVRRRGKPLVSKLFIAETDERNQCYRCQVIREQPFRSATNDVCQVCDRCNVDFQFLHCAPAAETSTARNDLPQPHQQPKSRRLAEKTKSTRVLALPKQEGKFKWVYGCGQLPAQGHPLLNSFTAAFRKAYAMDFYITKYQGKMMESLTPLFQCMTSGIHRLEAQERQEEEERKEAEDGKDDSHDASQVVKKRKTLEDLTRRARRVCIRLASMGNRCYWLSTTEVTVHILTSGDCLQSHTNVRLFCRQLQWAMQQCKRYLNHEVSLAQEGSGSQPAAQQSIQAVTVSYRTSANDDEKEDVDIEHMQAATTSTNTSDDYAHRGGRLQTMPFYAYRMYVKRILRPSLAKCQEPTIFAFDTHYVLNGSYVQEVYLHKINVPTIDGIQCPTWTQDPEQNSLLKSILFAPWKCDNPMSCGIVTNFQHMLSCRTCKRGTHDAAQPAGTASASRSAPQQAKYMYTFERAWRLRCSEIHVLAKRADSRCQAAKKKLVLADTVLFAEMKEPKGKIQHGEDTKQIFRTFTITRLQRRMPAEASRRILAFSGDMCAWHDEQCTLAEFCAYMARDVLAHIELSAEARVKQPSTNRTDAESDADTDR